MASFFELVGLRISPTIYLKINYDRFLRMHPVLKRSTLSLSYLKNTFQTIKIVWKEKGDLFRLEDLCCDNSSPTIKSSSLVDYTNFSLANHAKHAYGKSNWNICFNQFYIFGYSNSLPPCSSFWLCFLLIDITVEKI